MLAKVFCKMKTVSRKELWERHREFVSRQKEDVAVEPHLPSQARMVGELIKTAANVVVEAVTTGKLRASPEEQERRWSICRECDHFRASDARCGKNDGCGCWLAQAIIVSAKQCPVGKW